MRKHLALLVVVAMLLSLVACGGGETNSSEPTTTDPSTTVPSVTDPIYTYPTVDPSYTYPSYTDPTYTYPTTYPSYTYPSYTYPSYTYPMVTDPIVTDPIVTEPIVEEPTTTTTTVRVPTSSRRPKTTYRPHTTTGKNSPTEPTVLPTAPIVTDPSAPVVTDPSAPVATEPTAAPTTPVTPGAPAADHEEPNEINGAGFYDPQSSSIDEQAEEMRQNILNMPDTVKPSTEGTTYYVSFKGNDANDGLSPETAWRSTERVGQIQMIMRSGMVVLFERGGVYRGQMRVASGMSVGAYGTGPKPQLYAGDKNYADESCWEQTPTANVWKLTLGKKHEHIGNITFDYGKVQAGDKLAFSADGLKEDFNFYHDINNSAIYMYYSKGNPGANYESIEVSPKGAVLRRKESQTVSSNVTIENLCIRYSAFGISFATVENMKISGCEIGHIGGSMQTPFDESKDKFLGEMVRYGNGIEFYGNQISALVENNWIYQCYDAGYTNQGGANHKDITVRNNLIEYCHYNIEVFVDGSEGSAVEDTVYENNILRYASFGFGTYNRVGSGPGQGGNIRCGSNGTNSKNFVIRNNIFAGGQYGLVFSPYYDGVKGPKYEGNTWIQYGNYPALTCVKPGNRASETLSGGSLDNLKKAVGYLDKTAKVIYE